MASRPHTTLVGRLRLPAIMSLVPLAVACMDALDGLGALLALLRIRGSRARLRGRLVPAAEGPFRRHGARRCGSPGQLPGRPRPGELAPRARRRSAPRSDPPLRGARAGRGRLCSLDGGRRLPLRAATRVGGLSVRSGFASAGGVAPRARLRAGPSPHSLHGRDAAGHDPRAGQASRRVGPQAEPALRAQHCRRGRRLPAGGFRAHRRLRSAPDAVARGCGEPRRGRDRPRAARRNAGPRTGGGAASPP